MSLLCKVLAIHRFDQESHVHVPNVGSAARAGSQTVVDPGAQLACCLQSRRSWMVHSKLCQRALGLQRTRARLIVLERIREQSWNNSTGCLCGDRQSGGRSERFDCHSQYVKRFRGFDGAMGSASHSTVDGKIKAAACGSVGRRKSAGTSGTLHEVRLRATACQFAQPLANSRQFTPRARARHDPRR